MPKAVVLDSSVIVKWCNSLDEEQLAKSDKIFNDGKKGKIEIFIPELAKYEVGNAILNKKLELPAGKASLAVLYLAPVKFIPLDQELANRTLEIAAEGNTTYYDASFVSLAEKISATLVTDNPKHQKRTPKSAVKVVALENY